VTKEAKIGLLLGLVFIVGIAVVLRGVHQGEENMASETLAISQKVASSDEPEVPEKVKLSDAVEQLGPSREQEKPLANLPLPKAQLPKEPSRGAQGPVMLDGPTRYEQKLPEVAVAIQQRQDQLPNRMLGPATDKSTRADAVVMVTQKSSQIRKYVVREGDNLSKIALKMYDSMEGKRWVNVQRIYKANKKQMPSADTLKPGQVLIIPALPSRSVERVVKIVKSEPANQVKTTAKNKKAKVYVVREGDTLWDIAAEELGSGVRFSEIAEVNKKILADEDNLWVGMRLRLPEN